MTFLEGIKGANAPVGLLSFVQGWNANMFFSLEDTPMSADPILARKSGRRERPTFRPILETLENREVPTPAQVSAAFDQLPTAMNNLLASLAARPVDVNSLNTNLNIVINDMALLRTGGSDFVVGDRLRIDNALFSDGFLLLFDGFANAPFIPGPQFFNIVQVGSAAIHGGWADSLLAGLFPQTSGNATLT